jgi:RNA polymerase sigma-70 factor, ECF subfamily
MIQDRLSAQAGTVGFRAKSTIDDSPLARARVSQAVARAREGDQEAIRFLYVTYANNVYGYVRSIVRDDHEAEDLTQLVFAKLMTAIVKYDDRGVPFFAWLLRMARNLTIDHVRASRLVPSETLFDKDQCSGIDLDQAETVRAALETLPGDQREVVFLRHVVGLSPSEIADRMGRSEAAIHGLHHRGRRALKRELVELDAKPSTVSPRRLVACESASPARVAA